MPDARQRLTDIVHAAIREVNEHLPPGRRLPQDDGTVLLGEGGVLDSLGLINFLATIDDALTAQFGHGAGLLDSAMDVEGEASLRTVGTLIGHLVTRF